jgi:hypothetical protein
MVYCVTSCYLKTYCEYFSFIIHQIKIKRDIFPINTQPLYQYVTIERHFVTQLNLHKKLFRKDV